MTRPRPNSKTQSNVTSNLRESQATRPASSFHNPELPSPADVIDKYRKKVDDIINKIKLKEITEIQAVELSKDARGSAKTLCGMLFLSKGPGFSSDRKNNRIIRDNCYSEIEDVYRNSVRIISKESSHFSEYHAEYDSLDARLIRLEEFAVQNGGVGVAKFARKLFPELSGSRDSTASPPSQPQKTDIALPTSAPEVYPGLRSAETPPEFIMRVYEQWMGKGLTLAVVRKLDQPLVQALNYHLRRGRPVPEGFDLPTKYEQLDRELEALVSDRDRKEVSEIIGSFTAREASRVRSAMQRRQK